MKWVHVVDGQAVGVGPLPTDPEPNLLHDEDGNVVGVEVLTEAEQIEREQQAGYWRITETDPPAVQPNERLRPRVALVDGTWTQVWDVMQMTAQQIAERDASAREEELRSALRQSLGSLRQIRDNTSLPQSVRALAVAVIRLSRVVAQEFDGTD